MKISKLIACYRTLFDNKHFEGNCFVRPPAGGLSGIHFINIEEIPAENL
jgi:hypothetical protein